MHGFVDPVEAFMIDLFTPVPEPVIAGPEANGRMLCGKGRQVIFHLTVILLLVPIAVGAAADGRHGACPADVAAFFGSKQAHNFSLVSRAYHFFATTFLRAW